MNLEYREVDFRNTVLDKRFLVEKRIDAGGMSLLYYGKDLSTRCRIVIKICRSEEERGAFEQESRILRSLHHPHIQRIIGSGSIDGYPYYATPFYGSQNFREFLSDKTILPEMDLLGYFLQISAAVAYLHKRKILHNDLKPQNIIVQDENCLTLSDFGLACRAPLRKYIAAEQKNIWGSPVYLAPELPQGFSPSFASDVYALGVILFILALGFPPFYHDDLDTLIRMHQTEEPPHPSDLSGSISKELERIMLRAIAKSPAQRYTNAGKLHAAIQTYIKKDRQRIEKNTLCRHIENHFSNQEKTRYIP